MTHPAPDARRPRSAAEYRWTGRKVVAFLEALAQHGKVAAAARAVGMTRQSAYRLRDRAPKVAEGWVLAQTAGRARRKGKRAQGDASGMAR
jgi:molybdenum-dependent DNA-binding transcriptional regulator ModE